MKQRCAAESKSQFFCFDHKNPSINLCGYKINCKISSGFRHQVRCHLAWAGFPIINDKIYNSNFVDNNSTATTEKLQFYATKLEFYHPRTNQLVNFSIDV